MSAPEPEVILASEAVAIETDSQSLAKISEIDKAIQAMKVEYAHVPDVTDKKGLALAKERKGELVTMRTDGDKARKAFTKPLRDEIDRVNNLWSDDILPEIKKLEDPLAKAITAEKERVAENKRVAAEAEKARQDAIRARLHDLGTTPGTLISVESIDEYAASLDTIDMSEFEEFEQAATITIFNAREILTTRRATLQAQADEAQRLAEQAEEHKRIAAEQERIAAEQAAEHERITAEQTAQMQQFANDRQAFENEKAEAAAKAEKEKSDAADVTKRMAASVVAKEAENKGKKAAKKTAAALAPGKLKYTLWVDAIAPLPAPESPEEDNVFKQLSTEIQLMREFVDKIGARASQEA